MNHFRLKNRALIFVVQLSLVFCVFQDMMYAIQQEWMRMCTNLGDFEVERGKNILRTALLGRLDSTCTTADDIGRQILLFGKRLSPSEVNSRIQVPEPCSHFSFLLHRFDMEQDATQKKIRLESFLSFSAALIAMVLKLLQNRLL